MSSYVINKQEYIKAGGFFAGLADQLNYYREPVIYWWDSTKGDVLGAEDYYKAFASLYEMNARSVMLHHGDRRVESDEADYRRDFEHYRSIAAQLYTAAYKGSVKEYIDLQDAIFDFLHFCNSAKYQIEDEAIAKKANRFMYKAQHFLLKLLMELNHYKSDCWGSFDLENGQQMLTEEA